MVQPATCPNCGKQIGPTAYTCGFCRYHLRDRAFSGGPIVWLLAVAAAAAILIAFYNRDPAEGIKAARDVATRNDVLARLKDPSSAIFKDVDQGCGYVNSRNGFGGYTGFVPFIDTDGRATFAEDSSDFAHDWLTRCSGKLLTSPGS